MPVEERLGPEERKQLEEADKLLDKGSILSFFQAYQKLGVKIPEEKLNTAIKKAEKLVDDMAREGYNLERPVLQELKEYKRKHYPD